MKKRLTGIIKFDFAADCIHFFGQKKPITITVRGQGWYFVPVKYDV